MKIAHISDLHLSRLSFHITDWFSKRSLGMSNLLLSRKKSFLPERLTLLPDLLEELGVSALLISGDLTSTSLDQEFQLAVDFLKEIEKRKISLYLLPGNHDMYTREAWQKKSFYRFFEKWSDLSTLSQKGSALFTLDDQWQLLLLDCAKATSFPSSRGHFTKEIERGLLETLSSVTHPFVLCANHFPFTDQISFRKNLQGREYLKKILTSHPKIKIYLHGHNHLASLEDFRNVQLPLSIGAPSVTKKKDGGFNLLECKDSSCSISFFEFSDNNFRIKNIKNISL